MPAAKRKDNAGKLWTRDEVDSALIGIVAALSGQHGITRATSFGPKGLNWDKLAKLAVIKPVQNTLRERLDAGFIVGHINKVGDLCNAVWALMELVP